MADNTTENKLDEAIKNTLNTYEDPLDAGDWARMEAMLNAAPKTNTFRWTFPLTAFIGIAILSGGIIIYNTIHLKKTSTESAVETPQPFEKTAVPQKTLPLVPSFTKTEIPVISSPVKKELPAFKIKEKNISSVNKTTPNTNGNNTSTADALEKGSTKEKNKNVKESTIDKDSSKKQSVSVMGNEPIFGDMIDSSKGVIYETKEKNTTKKAAKSKSNTPIGWDLLNQNIEMPI
jgi:type IV secretory pathway VirB10-like protein